mgnify:CR=1 FL=1
MTTIIPSYVKLGNEHTFNLRGIVLDAIDATVCQEIQQSYVTCTSNHKKKKHNNRTAPESNSNCLKPQILIRDYVTLGGVFQQEHI